MRCWPTRLWRRRCTARSTASPPTCCRRPEWITLSTLIYQRLGRPGAANLDAALVLACGLMGLALLVFVLIEGRDRAEPPPAHA